MRTMDLIEPEFRPLYEKICVGNKGEDKQDIFFEGMLLKRALVGEITAAQAPRSVTYFDS
jgi:hypothetical protein